MDVHGPYQSKQGLGALNKVQAERLWRNAVHNPSEVTASERKTLRETYVEEVEFTDREIGRLIQYLRDDGLYGEALVILTADHGDEFFEHGSYSHENKLYEELIHVPLVVKLPDSLDPIGEAVEQSLIPLLDIAPTLCDVAGAETEGFEGQSLFCSATDRTQQSCDRDDRLISEAIVSEAQALPEYIGAVRTPTWKYIRTRNETELYNLSEDSDETTDVSGTELQVVERVGSHLDAHIELRATADEEGSVHDGTTVDDRLRSLGYLE
jgi:arylsulfatase